MIFVFIALLILEKKTRLKSYVFSNSCVLSACYIYKNTLRLPAKAIKILTPPKSHHGIVLGQDIGVRKS